MTDTTRPPKPKPFLIQRRSLESYRERFRDYPDIFNKIDTTTWITIGRYQTENGRHQAWCNLIYGGSRSDYDYRKINDDDLPTAARRQDQVQR